jgi:hypothetical protein
MVIRGAELLPQGEAIRQEPRFDDAPVGEAVDADLLKGAEQLLAPRDSDAIASSR